VSPARRIVVYSIVRVLLFAIPFTVLMLLEVWWWVSAILAAIVAACLSYLFLNRQRHEVAEVVVILNGIRAAQRPAALSNARSAEQPSAVLASTH